MRVGLKLTDAEASGDGNGIFLVRISQQSQRRRLRGELVSRQETKFGKAAQRVAGRTIIGLLISPSLIRGNAQKPRDQVTGTESGMPALQVLLIPVESRAQLDHLPGRAVEYATHAIGQAFKMLPKIILGELRAGEYVGSPRLLRELDGMSRLRLDGLHQSR